MSLKDKGEDSADNDNETDNIDDRVHDFSPQIASAVENAMPGLGFRSPAPGLALGGQKRRRRSHAWGSPGGAERNRTADLLIANEALYQLSYGPQEGAELGVRRISVKRLKGRPEDAAQAHVTDAALSRARPAS